MLNILNKDTVTIKLCNASGALLDYLVAKIVYPHESLYYDQDEECYITPPDQSKVSLPILYQPTKKWGHGGPIIENNNINTATMDETHCGNEERYYAFCIPSESESHKMVAAYGQTMLESCMRAFVMMTFGEIYELDKSECLGRIVAVRNLYGDGDIDDYT